MHCFKCDKNKVLPVVPKLHPRSLYLTVTVHCFIQLPFPCSSPSGPGNGGEVGSQEPLTLRNLRADPCAGSSEVERSGISLAGLLHITQWKLYFFLCQPVFLFLAFWTFILPFLSGCSLWLCSYADLNAQTESHVRYMLKVHMWATHTWACSIFGSDLHGDSQRLMAQTQTVCCNNTVTCVHSASVSRAVACWPCQLMHSSSQLNNAVGWWQSYHSLI